MPDSYVHQTATHMLPVVVHDTGRTYEMTKRPYGKTEPIKLVFHLFVGYAPPGWATDRRWIGVWCCSGREIQAHDYETEGSARDALPPERDSTAVNAVFHHLSIED